MDGTKITRQRDERMASYMVGTKITLSRDGRHKNNSPKGRKDWQLNGRFETISPEHGELNGQHENNSPKGWTGRELNGLQNSPKDEEFNCLHEYDPPKRWMAHAKEMDGWRVKCLTQKQLCQRGLLINSPNRNILDIKLNYIKLNWII